MINIETHINHKFDGQGTRFDGGQNESNKKKNGKRIRFQPRHTKNRKSHILGRILWLLRKCDFHFPWMFLFTFSERNDLAEVKRSKNNSNGAIVYDDDAHIVVLCTRSHFLSTRWVLLRSKEKTLKIQV